MHKIEKNKDDLKRRKGISIYCNRKELELIIMGDRVLKPKATNALSIEEIKLVLKWLKRIKFPDGYISNIAYCVNTDHGIVYGFKSHHYHVLK